MTTDASENTPAPTCCSLCVDVWAMERPMSSEVLMAVSGRMFVCSECGNKRCPKATDHRLACTGSNEPGQEGSRYAAR